VSNAQYLPLPPQPPHDPLSLLLTARQGWPIASSSSVTAAKSIGLKRDQDSLRQLHEESGSFGGLRLPRNVAMDARGTIFLFDGNTCTLKQFDPCQCLFATVFRFGTGAGAYELTNPSGIAMSDDSLYVCDTGNQRVSVFAIPTLALRGHWSPPVSWQPTCVVVKGHSILVGDAENGVIHRFSRRGQYQDGEGGYGPIASLALDRDGNLYAATLETAYKASAQGPAELTLSADELGPNFEALPFEVDSSGFMRLGSLCIDPVCSAFDTAGNCVTPDAIDHSHVYQLTGSVVLGPLDSRIEGCVWHRVILHGQLPPGCSVEVQTTTSEIDRSPAEIENLLDHSWETNLRTWSIDGGKWDCLVQGQPGRYLWLKLNFTSQGASSPEFQAIEIEYPRISLRRYLPAIYGADPQSADFTDRFLAIFDRSLRDYELKIDGMAGLFDPMATQQLDWLATWIGVNLDHQLSEPIRRRLLQAAGRSQNMRGTLVGLHETLLQVLGFDEIRDHCPPQICSDRCTPAPETCPPTPAKTKRWCPPPLILEHFKLRRWMELGTGRLGDQAVLWGKSIVNRSQLGQGATVGGTQIKGTQDPLRDPFHFYAHKFTVFVPVSAGDTPQKRQSLENLLRRESPAHTESHIEYVSPRFRIGFQSSIGLNSVIGRLPSGVTLNQSVLGQATVLTGDESPKGIGAQRIGTTQI
jgi:phage tail-like protein